MAKKTPQAAEEKPLEFWVDDMQFEDAVLLILAREVEDGALRGKVRLLPKATLTLDLFARTYEQMLHDYKADHNEHF